MGERAKNKKILYSTGAKTMKKGHINISGTHIFWHQEKDGPTFEKFQNWFVNLPHGKYINILLHIIMGLFLINFLLAFTIYYFELLEIAF